MDTSGLHKAPAQALKFLQEDSKGPILLKGCSFRSCEGLSFKKMLTSAAVDVLFGEPEIHRIDRVLSSVRSAADQEVLRLYIAINEIFRMNVFHSLYLKNSRHIYSIKHLAQCPNCEFWKKERRFYLNTLGTRCDFSKNFFDIFTSCKARRQTVLTENRELQEVNRFSRLDPRSSRTKALYFPPPQVPK